MSDLGFLYIHYFKLRGYYVSFIGYEKNEFTFYYDGNTFSLIIPDYIINTKTYEQREYTKMCKFIQTSVLNYIKDYLEIETLI